MATKWRSNPYQEAERAGRAQARRNEEQDGNVDHVQAVAVSAEGVKHRRAEDAAREAVRFGMQRRVQHGHREQEGQNSVSRTGHDGRVRRRIPCDRHQHPHQHDRTKNTGAGEAFGLHAEAAVRRTAETPARSTALTGVERSKRNDSGENPSNPKGRLNNRFTSERSYSSRLAESNV